MAAARGHDEIIRPVVLQDLPHRLHVFRGPAPVTANIDVAEREPLGRAVCDPHRCRHYLLRDEVRWAQRRFVVEKDARRGEESVGLAVVRYGVVGCDLCDPVGAPWVESSRFIGRQLRVAKHLTRTSVVEPHWPAN